MPNCGITKERARMENLLNWRQVGSRNLTADEKGALDRSTCALGKNGVIRCVLAEGRKAIRKSGTVRR